MARWWCGNIEMPLAPWEKVQLKFTAQIPFAEEATPTGVYNETVAVIVGNHYLEPGHESEYFTLDIPVEVRVGE